LSEDTSKIELLARSIKSHGSGFGFEPISEAATRIETAVQNAAPMNEIRAQVEALIKLCLQTRSTSRQP
jgi:hypothetical protein